MVIKLAQRVTDNGQDVQREMVIGDLILVRSTSRTSGVRSSKRKQQIVTSRDSRTKQTVPRSKARLRSFRKVLFVVVKEAARDGDGSRDNGSRKPLPPGTGKGRR